MKMILLFVILLIAGYGFYVTQISGDSPFSILPTCDYVSKTNVVRNQTCVCSGKKYDISKPGKDNPIETVCLGVPKITFYDTPLEDRYLQRY